MKIGRYLFFISILLCAALSAGGLSAQSHTLGESDPVQIVLDADAEPLARLAAERLREYLTAVTGDSRVTVISRESEAPSGAFQVRLTQAVLPYFQRDGFQIRSQLHRSSPRVVIRAPSGAGLRHGVQRWIEELRQRGRTLEIPEVEVEADPWMKRRELFIAEIEWHPTPGEEPLLSELQQEYSWLNWDVDRLRTYIDMVHDMGYNAVMLSDSQLMRRYAGESSTVDEGLAKVREMFRYTREDLEMGTSFFLWGQKGTEEDLPVPNPRDPEQYRLMVDNWMLMMDRYGGLADQWILHWADPGGCDLGDCTIYTPQAASNHFLRLFRSRGFSSLVNFSLWALRWGGWPGYESWRDVVESGILDPEMGIALMRNFDYETARTAVLQGREVGVWGWYANDLEVNPALHVHSRILENEFNRIDSSASRLASWYSLEDNDHILNIPSLYVGARLLWDADGSGDELLSRFCRAVWGETVGPRVLKALQAIEDIRCGPGDPMAARDLWPHGYLCRRGWRTGTPAADLARADEALETVRNLAVDSRIVPKLELVTTPEFLLDQIKAHLRYVRDFAAFRLAYRKALEPAIWDGDLEATQAAMADLPELSSVVEGSYGAIEFSPYMRFRGFAASWAERRFDHWALGRPVTASSVFDDDPRFAPSMAVNGILCEFEEEGWAADGPGPAWLKIDLEEVRTISRVRIYNRGYERANWDESLMATPARVQLFLAESDPSPEEGAAGLEEGYTAAGVIEDWAPSRDPADFRELTLPEPREARFVKVVIYEAADGHAPGTGEIEVW